VTQNANYFADYKSYVEKYRGYEDRDPDNIFDELIRETDYISGEGKDLIRQAYEIAKKWHAWQLRKSGAPYITHPLTVACMMLPYRPCPMLLGAALLHDVLEDTKETFESIAAIHPDMANIVEWATKIRWASRKDPNGLAPEQARFETIRKILVASQKDIRILYLKIFDRSHNMITIESMSPEGRQRMAEETQHVYIPLAKRCGLREMYHFLHGLTAEVLEEEKWETMKTFITNKHDYMVQSAKKIHAYLRKQNWSKPIIHYDTDFVSPFSIELKKEYQEESWYAIQIVVRDPGDCYSILHDIGTRQDQNLLQVWRITDLINHPRLSGYTGLHTEIVFEGTSRVKIRIIDEKTYEKVLQYETFDELGKIYAPVLFRDFDLINEATASNSEDFMTSVTEHILARKIRLHSKTQHLFYMPIKSTVLDGVVYLEPKKFQYIDSIYRNHEKVPFYTPLEDDDIITFDLWDSPTVTKQWLEFVSSGIAQWRILSYLDKKN
jgi:GTP diphosphokinase / guanosine-3',5'-bis(diphosphate) 3'-diphosphatase